MQIKFRTKKEPENHVQQGVKLVVTGVTNDEKKKLLQQELEKKGIKAVVTSEPVLGVFDL
jgi:hypothetical protein